MATCAAELPAELACHPEPSCASTAGAGGGGSSNPSCSAGAERGASASSCAVAAGGGGAPAVSSSAEVVPGGTHPPQPHPRGNPSMTLLERMHLPQAIAEYSNKMFQKLFVQEQEERARADYQRHAETEVKEKMRGRRKSSWSDYAMGGGLVSTVCLLFVCPGYIGAL